MRLYTAVYNGPNTTARAHGGQILEKVAFCRTCILLEEVDFFGVGGFYLEEVFFYLVKVACLQGVYFIGGGRFFLEEVYMFVGVFFRRSVALVLLRNTMIEVFLLNLDLAVTVVTLHCWWSPRNIS